MIETPGRSRVKGYRSDLFAEAIHSRTNVVRSHAMLFAELHGKLNPTASDVERREDVLTSTVFGTLLIAGSTRSVRACGSRVRFVTS